jgi:DNA polymerase V
MEDRRYAAIDLKSFFASVECMERGLDPMTTNLVVADESRTEKTICLAVSPSLKAYGIPGRARLFEATSKIKEVNGKRIAYAPKRSFSGSSSNDVMLKSDPSLAVDFIIAPPQMAKYMDYSTKIYNVYLKYVAPEDIHVYSIDEVFIDLTKYLKLYGMTARELTMKMILDVLATTGITATAGIGTNLYLCKIAMDIEAKHIKADKNGVRIAELDEMSYRRSLWSHTPITDFWRVGKGYAKKLAQHGMYTMGDVARCSVGKPSDYYNEELLYKLFGINAELLIDHAWGWEPCTIAEIKAYKPETNSICSGQVLQSPYTFEKTRLIVKEMTDMLVLDLVDKGLVTNQLVLTVGYDIENLSDPKIRSRYKGEITTDFYGRDVPKHAHGSITLDTYSSSTKLISAKVNELFDRIVDPLLLTRRLTVTANNVIKESDIPQAPIDEQLDIFADFDRIESEERRLEEEREKEKRIQKTLIGIKKKYGKNAIVRGMNLEDGATAIERNKQIGGHKA